MDGESSSQPTSTSAPCTLISRKRSRSYSESIWPKRVKKEEANTLVAMKEGVWETVEYVTIMEEKYKYMEHKECNYDLSLAHGTFEINCGNWEVNLPCRPVQQELFVRAKLLYEQVLSLPNMKESTDHTITCHSRAARQAEPDSDGEDIPDPAIIPAFSDKELGIVNLFFRKLFNAYQRAMQIGLYNCVGKNFLDVVGSYVDLCTCLDVTKPSCFLFIHNTSTGSPQPGALYIKWSLSTTTERKRKVITRERYSDHIAYSTINSINVIVSEVKESEDTAVEAQNNEQMLGLWKGSQQAMLGLEVQGHTVRPKVLCLIEGILNMCYMNELDLAQPDNFLELVKLMMAFCICVDYCQV